MHEVSAITAPGIEDTHAGSYVSAQDLIKDVDIDLAELFLDAYGQSASISFSAIRRNWAVSVPKVKSRAEVGSA
jgi:hypothetical protein